MCRECGSEAHEHAERKVDEVLQQGGVLEIVQQGDGALRAASTALGHLIRAERAEALGLGADVAELHRAAARRENRRACKQLEIVAERIDARRNDKDWAALVKRTRDDFRKHGGRQSLTDTRDDLRLRLFEQDPGLSGPVSEQALGLFDRTVEIAGDGDLNKMLDLMKEHCRAAREGFAEEQMGRQPASQALYHTDPRGGPEIAGGQDVNGWCVALAACIAWATSSLVASIIICAAIVLCWCCFIPALLFSYGLHMATCSIAFQMGCNSR